MRVISILLASVAAAASSGAAHAQERLNDGRGIYLSVDVGNTSLSDTDLDFADDGGTFGGTGATDTIQTEVKTKDAVGFGGAIGYDFGIIRADVEVDYARNKIRGLQINSVNGTAVTSISAVDVADFCDYAEIDGCSASGNTVLFDGGRVRQASGLVNLWADLPIGSRLTAYAGGGIGIGGFEVEGEGKGRFAWQLGAGLAFHVSPKIAITADYRHRVINGTTFTDDAFPDYALRVGKLKSDAVSAGLRFTF